MKVIERSLRKTVLFFTYCTIAGQSLPKTFHLNSLSLLFPFKMKTTSVLGRQHDISSLMSSFLWLLPVSLKKKSFMSDLIFLFKIAVFKCPHCKRDHSFISGRGPLVRTVPSVSFQSNTETQILKLSWHMVYNQQPCAASGRCRMKIVTANYMLANSLFPMQSGVTCSLVYSTALWLCSLTNGPPLTW